MATNLSGRLTGVFYLVVLCTSLTGASTSATGWLNWSLPAAIVVVSAVELGGVALSVHADERRQLGEPAMAARLLSAAVAVGAVAVNWFGHVGHHVGQAALFAGMSALGYCVYLIRSGAKRRDRLRAAGKMRDTAPAFGAVQWLRHPWLTRRARLLALDTPSLGVLGSLAAAREQVRCERRDAAIAATLHKAITATVGGAAAEIAVRTYDLNKIAARLAARADYNRLTDLIAADLTPEKLSGKAKAVSERLRADLSADLTPEVTPEVTGQVSADLTAVQPDLSARPGSNLTAVQVPAVKGPVRAKPAGVSVEALADTLAAAYPDSVPGRPKALTALRAKYGSCSNDRATAAIAELTARRLAPTNGHNHHLTTAQN